MDVVMNPKKAVLFDLDGTLVDTIRDIGSAMNSVLELHGLPLHDLDAYRLMVGLGVRNLVAQAIPKSRLDPETVTLLTAEMMEHYARFPLVHSRPYEGITELLAALRARAIPTAVLSNKPDALTKVIVERLFPEHPFAFVQGERPEVPQKPDPTAALSICASLGISPADALFLGDSAVDVETAHNAGMACAGAAWGFRGAEELREAGAEILVRKATDVLGLVIKG
jgi:phosphoglycolate phosphatase